MAKKANRVQKDGVLFVTRNFPPLVGGMEHLIFNCAIQVSSQFKTTIVGPPGGDAFIGSGVVYVAARVKHALAITLVSFLLNSLIQSIRQRPKIVFCGSGLMAPIGYLCARIVRAKCVVYLHGLDIVVDNWFYQNIFMRFIRRFDLVIVNSESSFCSALERRVSEAKLRILYPGTDVPGFHPDKAEKFKDELGLNNGPTLLYVGRITKRKGLLEFVENCMVSMVRQLPGLKVLVVGDDAMNSVAANDPIIEKLQSYIAKNSLEKHFVFFGETTDRKTVSKAYWSADLVVFPVHLLPNDIEGFGMVAVEAAAHGIPTIAFRVGGLLNSVKDGFSGVLIDYPDYLRFAETTVCILKKETLFDPGVCVEYGRKYSWEKFGETLCGMLFDLCPESRRAQCTS